MLASVLAWSSRPWTPTGSVVARAKKLAISWEPCGIWATLNPNNLLRSISHTAQGAYFRYNVNPRLSVRAQYVQGSVEVFDADHPNAHQQRRDLGFFNLVNELSATTEVNFRDHVVGNPKRRLVPFLTAGVAVFGHDPQGHQKQRTPKSRFARSAPKVKAGSQGNRALQELGRSGSVWTGVERNIGFDHDLSN